MKYFFVLLFAVSASFLFAQGNSALLRIDTLDQRFVQDSGLHDGGGCWYVGGDKYSTDYAQVVAEESNKEKKEAIACLGGHMLVLKQDSVQHKAASKAGNNTQTETVAFYSDATYILVIDTFESSGSAEGPKGRMVVRLKQGAGMGFMSIAGTCGAN